LNDGENGVLNSLGVNCLRALRDDGVFSWGARTLAGADGSGSEYKYISVRRLELYIEQSVQRGTKWAVFEPDDEPLWAQIRLNVGAFLYTLFREGALQGRTEREAYFVKCGHDTMSQEDVDAGRVIIEIGFAPLKPAEFVVITIGQWAGAGTLTAVLRGESLR
jgi:phage tail sheath protein FI